MHHFIYPSQDTFITDTTGFKDLNFGLDEILRVGTQNTTLKVYSPTTIYPFNSGSFVTNLHVQGFSGSLATASFNGSASYILGYVFDTSVDPVSFIVDYFSGSFIGSLVGWVNGVPYSSSNATGSIAGFSGSIVIHSLATGSTWDGLLFEYNNWFSTWQTVMAGSGSINGLISGSLSSSFTGIFNGSISGFTGQILIGNIAGVDILDIQSTKVVTDTYNNRALVQFDLTSISQSIANGDIIDPVFRLKLYVAREFNLPIQYNVYAFPISESWVMGNGYVSDGGSTQGANWLYRDYDGGTPWAVTGSSYVQSLGITQSFNYQVGDINMDVTPIVNAWLSGTVPNNGIVLISSDEFAPTGSGMSLRFFSKDTNTIYEPILDVGWSDFSWSTGSIVTSSINVATIPAGVSGIVSDSGSISGSIYGGFSGVGNITMGISGSASGLISVTGANCLITSMSISGDFSGSVSSSIVTLIKKCRKCHPHAFNMVNDSDYSAPFYPGAGDDEAYLVNSNEDFWVIDGQFPSMYPPCPNVPSFISSQLSYLQGGQDQTQYQGHDIYGWGHPFNEFNQYNWTSDHVFQDEFGPGSIKLDGCGPTMATMSYVMGTLIDGLFSGSVFTSSLFRGYILGRGWLVGNWNESMILGTSISASYSPQPMFPTAVNVIFSGSYVSGPAFGSITSLSASNNVFNYGIFDGIFINGFLAGMKIHAPFTGSVLTSSYDYTSSLNITSSSLSPVDVRSAFTTVIQSLPPSVNAGNIIKVRVFARPEFPLKNFDRQTQFTQFLIPQYLPTSSYYAIKDNETEQIILDFDNYTQISCDSNGNYFLLDTTSYPQERYFRILIKVEQSGSINTIDHDNIFKIVR
jgi:hypothetical protein